MINFSSFPEATGLKWHWRNDLSPEERPSEMLLRQHFQQCILRHVLGPYRSEGSSYEKMIEAFVGQGNEDYDVHLKHPRWTSDPGKRVLENYLTDRLFTYLPCIETPGVQAPRSRFPADRFYAKETVSSVDNQNEWPEKFSVDEDTWVVYLLRRASAKRRSQGTFALLPEAAVPGLPGNTSSTAHIGPPPSYIPPRAAPPPKYVPPGRPQPPRYIPPGRAPPSAMTMSSGKVSGQGQLNPSTLGLSLVKAALSPSETLHVSSLL